MTTIKRFLTLFTILTTLSLNYAWGADATFTFSAQGYANAETVTSGTIDTYSSWTATKGGSNDPKYYNTGTGLRVYNGGSFSISSSKTIASITLTFSSSDYTFSSSNTTTPQTVTPDATSYEWSVSRTCRLQKIEITYTSGGTSTVATPTFSPAEGSYSSTQSVTISCATTGATVYYTTDGSTPTTSSTEYSSAISVSTTTTIKAIATKSGMTTSAVASATYTISSGGGGSDCFTWDLTTNSYTTGTNEVTWSHAYATMHNSGTNATNYLGGDANNRTSSRFYSGNALTITPASGVTITSITFTATSTSYANTFNGSTWTNATSSVSGSTVTVTPTNGATTVSASVGGTCGFTSVQVCYTTSGGGTPTLSSISVSTPPTKTSYTAGEYFDPTGLVITRTYSNSTSDTYTYASHTSEFSFSPSPSTALTTSNTSVTITYGGKSTTQTITVTSGGGSTATFTPTSSSAGTLSGEPSGASAVFVNTYNSANQITGNNSQTLTLSGFDDYTITAITLNVKNNASSGAGTVSVSVNGVEIGTGSVSGLGGSYTEVNIPITSTLVNENGNIVITINCTTNSVFCEWYKVTYEALALPTYEVKFYNDGILIPALTTSVTKNQTISPFPTLTTGDACDGTSNLFAGWTQQTIDEKSTTINTDQYVDSWTKVTGPLELNALWAKEDATTSTFNASSTDNITRSSEYNEWSENTTGIIFGGSKANDRGSYFEIAQGTADNVYMYVEAPNKVISKYVATINGTVASYGIGSVSDGSLSSTSSSPQTVSGVNTNFTEAYTANTYIRISNLVVTTYTDYITSCTPYVKTPEISPVTGNYYRASGQGITLTCATEGATIYYTTDGSTPTTSSTVYSGEILFSTFSVGDVITIKAIATHAGMHNSAVATETYTIYEDRCKRPTFTPGTGTYSTDQDIVINCATAGATIYYTTDGTDPTTSGTRAVYSTAIHISGDGEHTIYAYAEKTNYINSDLSYAVITIATPHTITYHVPSGVTCPPAESTSRTTLPTGITELCDEWHFVGWSSANIPTATTSATILSGEYSPTADVDLYAVYSAEVSSGGTPKYTKVTSAPSDWSGEYLIVYETGAVAFNGGLATLDATENTISVSISSSEIEANSTTDAAKFTIAKKNDAYTIQSASGYYIGRTASSNGFNADASTQYTNTISLSSSNAVITSSGGPTLRFNAANNQLRFRYYASGQQAIQLYKRSGATQTQYWSAPTCTACTEASVTLSSNNVILKADESAEITITSSNASAITLDVEDLSIATATMTGNTITITGVDDGTTTLIIRQNRDVTDPSHPICGVNIVVPITVKDALIDVVDVGTTYITIEHDYGASTSINMQEQLTTLDSEPAEDIFFSKYYEASSNMKLFALYNGTEDPIDLSKLRVRSSLTATTWSSTTGNLNYVELGNVSKLRREHKNAILEPFTEIIFWSNNKGTQGENNWTYNENLRACINMSIKGKTYTYADLARDNVPNWYCLGDSVRYNTLDTDGNNQFNFNGDDPLILERKVGELWVPIDLIGAGTSAAPNSSACVKITDDYEINGVEQDLNDEPGGWVTYTSGGATLTIPYSTNRYMLTRKKEVKSGLRAVDLNKTDFVTLADEWNGIAVGGNHNDCYSGTMFSEVGKYDYANYYSEFRTLEGSAATATPQDDGTVKVTIPDLVDRACDYLNIQVIEGSDTIAQMKYKVPIIVSTDKATTDAIFYNEGAKGCARCDVVVLAEATLTKAADGTLHDMPEIRDLEIYAGGKLVVPDGSNYNYTMRSLTIRANEDNVGAAHIEGSIITDNIYHDKRMRGGSNGRWYWMCLPYACNIKDVHFRNGEAAIYGTDWWLQAYDGQARVNTASGAQNGWKMINAGELTQLQPGVGYIVAVATKDGHTFGELRFPMAGYQESATKYVPVDDYGAGVDVTPNHKGWNLVGNPFMDYYLKDNLSGQGLTLGKLVLNTAGTAWEIETPATVPYITLPVNGGYSEYAQTAANAMDLPPFISYFVQVAGSNPDTDESDLKVAFDPSHRGKSSIRRRYQETDENAPIWVAVALRNAGDETDETTLVISDNYTDDYEIGGDLYKWRGAYYQYAQITTKPVLASRNAAGEMAFNAVPDNTAKTGVPLNYFAAANGEYTFSLKRNYNLENVESVLLVDMQEGINTDLLDNDYTFYTNRGDNTSRFKLIVNVNRAPKIATGFEHLGYSDSPRKVLINGHVYIVRGRAVYDLTGKQLLNQ